MKTDITIVSWPFQGLLPDHTFNSQTKNGVCRSSIQWQSRVYVYTRIHTQINKYIYIRMHFCMPINAIAFDMHFQASHYRAALKLVSTSLSVSEEYKVCVLSQQLAKSIVWATPHTSSHYHRAYSSLFQSTGSYHIMQPLAAMARARMSDPSFDARSTESPLHGLTTSHPAAGQAARCRHSSISGSLVLGGAGCGR